MATIPTESLPTGLSDDLAVALKLTAAAAEMALSFFETGVKSSLKDDGSPVTEADIAVQSLLMELLGRHRPEDGVLSEEGGSRPGVARRWILDPIDGTVNFAVGDPNWGTHVALEIDGRVAVGVITRPVVGETWWAVRGGGAFRSSGMSPPERFRVSTVDTLAEARVTCWPPDPGPMLDALKAAAKWQEPDWSLLRNLLEGELDVIVAMAGGPWDHAPGVLLTQEAGGRFGDRQGGERLDAGGGLYSNGRLHDQITALLAQA
jgi:histidinol-phosphatase